MIKHHVKEEEKPAGMFARARQSQMDLAQLGEQLAERKMEMTSRMDGSSGLARAPGRAGKRPERRAAQPH